MTSVQNHKIKRDVLDHPSKDDPRTFHKQHVTHDPQTSRKKFSAQMSSGEQDGGCSDRELRSGREQNSAMYHIPRNAQWSGDQLHVRSERWLRGSDEGNPEDILKLVVSSIQ